jgi:hypothetical protein
MKTKYLLLALMLTTLSAAAQTNMQAAWSDTGPTNWIVTTNLEPLANVAVLPSNWRVEKYTIQTNEVTQPVPGLWVTNALPPVTRFEYYRLAFTNHVVSTNWVHFKRREVRYMDKK